MPHSEKSYLFSGAAPLYEYRLYEYRLFKTFVVAKLKKGVMCMLLKFSLIFPAI